jgi:hypothetical protein
MVMTAKRGAHAEKMHSDSAWHVFTFDGCARRLHTCKLSAGRRWVTVLVSNPYPQEMHCTVNCHVTFSGEGINIVGITCAKSVLGGVKDFELCSRTRDYIDVFVKLADAGNSECIKPLAEQKIDNDGEDGQAWRANL